MDSGPRYHPSFPNVPLTRSVADRIGFTCDVMKMPVKPGDILWSNREHDVDIMEQAMPECDVRFHPNFPGVPLVRTEIAVSEDCKRVCDVTKTPARAGLVVWSNRERDIDVLDSAFQSAFPPPGPHLVAAPPSTSAFPKRQLDVDAAEFVLSIGEQGFLPDACGFGSMMVPTSDVSEFQSADPGIVVCRREDVTPPGLMGGARYEHQFLPVRPGTTEVRKGSKSYVVRVLEVFPESPGVSAGGYTMPERDLQRFHPNFPGVPLVRTEITIADDCKRVCDVTKTAARTGMVVWSNRERDIDVLDSAFELAAAPLPTASPKRSLTGYNNTMPGPGAGGAGRGYVILGPQSSWSGAPTALSVLGQTVPVGQEATGFMARGLNLRDGSHAATVTLGNGAAEAVEVNVSTVC